MNYREWVGSLPKEITEDTLWKMEAYRLALFSSEIGWHDVTELMKYGIYRTDQATPSADTLLEQIPLP